MNSDFLESILESLANTNARYFKLESSKKKVEIIKSASCGQHFTKQKVEELQLKTKEDTKLPAKDNTIDIVSPHVGFFRRSRKTGERPLVKLREVIEKNKLVAYINSMNLQYEVTSNFSGKVIEILVEDGQAVEFAQPLFRLRSDDQ